MKEFDGELSPPFEIVEPSHWRAPIIFNSPHSGSVYPLEFLNASRIDLAALRRSEDSFMDELIGDRYGTSCASLLPDVVEEIMSKLGYSIGRNKPYAGGFITEHYGNPGSGLHAIQIELNRAIYMDERSRERGANFARVAADIATLADVLATTIPFADLGPFQTAAE